MSFSESVATNLLESGVKTRAPNWLFSWCNYYLACVYMYTILLRVISHQYSNKRIMVLLRQCFRGTLTYQLLNVTEDSALHICTWFGLHSHFLAVIIHNHASLEQIYMLSHTHSDYPHTFSASINHSSTLV